MTQAIDKKTLLSHSSHWGAFSVVRRGDDIEVIPHPDDPAPSPILGNFPGARSHRARILQPAIRRGWLENGPGGKRDARGSDEFVPVSWEVVNDLLPTELTRVARDFGLESVFGGSYGWSSAGRFHHAQSQVHRFLNTTIGGYTRSVNTYSAGAAEVILPRVAGPLAALSRHEATWDDIANHSELVVSFGGMAIRNSMVSAGGTSRHNAPESFAKARARGAGFVLVSPLKDDFLPSLDADWVALRPSTDVALMLGVAHTLHAEGLYDADFVQRYCEGFEQFESYLTGAADGTAKDADWAASICGIAADRIQALARRMAAHKTLITVSHSLQRSEGGEQPVWMGLVLGAMLGRMAERGAGFIYGIGAIANIGKPALDVPIPTLPQGVNGTSAYIPVARISDLLLNPGQELEYNGTTLTYPDIRLVYWAGGNPFHHHQDLNRLRAAFARPETIIVHDAFWTATARHADFVLPATMTLERNDIGAAANDPKLIAMKAAFDPFGQARDDYEIFAALAEAMGQKATFTENRTSEEWLRHLYEPTREALAQGGHEAPTFDEFWERGELDLPVTRKPGLMLRFLADPEKNPLPTPSGRIEVFSKTIDGFGYAEIPGHPKWTAPAEWLGGDLATTWPLQLVANQPNTRLHSQLDFGSHSQDGKANGREPARINPLDAQSRNIRAGDTVRLFNGRGSCLATAVITEDVRPGVIQLATGAWYTPMNTGGTEMVCVHGNPNVLTRDRGTSRLAQGSTGQLSLVEVELFTGNLDAFDPYAAPA